MNEVTVCIDQLPMLQANYISNTLEDEEGRRIDVEFLQRLIAYTMPSCVVALLYYHRSFVDEKTYLCRQKVYSRYLAIHFLGVIAGVPILRPRRQKLYDGLEAQRAE